MNIEFVSKHPHRTLFLEVSHREEDSERLASLKQALGKIGFVENKYSALPVDGVTKTTFSKAGTGLFEGWTTEEHKVNMLDARRVLRGLGFTKVPHRHIDWRDFE